MDVCYIFIFYIHHFLLTEQMWQPSKDVSLIIKVKMVSGKCQCFFEETCPKGNNNISNCPEICIVLCKMSSMSSVNYGRGCTASSVVPMLSK